MRPESVGASCYLDPTHTHHLIIYHEPQCVGQVRLVCHWLKDPVDPPRVSKAACLKECPELIDILGQSGVDLQESALLCLIVHDRGLISQELNCFHVLGLMWRTCIWATTLWIVEPLVQVILNRQKIVTAERDSRMVTNLNVEIRSEIVHMDGYWVT